MNEATNRGVAALRIPHDLFIVGQPFTRNELHAMSRLGQLREMLPGIFVQATIADTVALRARLALFVSGREIRERDVALCRSTAAWVYGYLPYVSTLNIATGTYHRPSPERYGMPVLFHETTLPDEEVVQLSKLPITTAERTLLDLACHAELPIAHRALHHLAKHPDARTNLPRLQSRLAQLEPRPEVLRGRRLIGALRREAAA